MGRSVIITKLENGWVVTDDTGNEQKEYYRKHLTDAVQMAEHIMTFTYDTESETTEEKQHEVNAK